MDKDTRIAELEQLVRDGVRAFDLTRVYVGHDMLPCTKTWAWFDWCKRSQDMVEDVIEFDCDTSCAPPLLLMDERYTKEEVG